MSAKCYNLMKISIIARELRRDLFLSFKDLVNQLSSCQGRIRVSKDTVRRAVGKRGISAFAASRKLLINIKHKLNKRRWCKERLHWAEKEW